MKNDNKEISFDNEENNENNENNINIKDNDNLIIDKKNYVTENDGNTINIIKNDDHHKIPENKDNLKKEMEISEEELEELSDIIFNQTIFNKKKQK